MSDDEKWQDITILIGNGLGMGLLSNCFSLSETLSSAWEDSDLNLSQKFKTFCRQFSKDSLLPTQEEQIDEMHLFFDSLNRIREMNKVYTNKINVELFEFSTEYIKLSHYIVDHFSRCDQAIAFSDQYSTYIILLQNLTDFIKTSYFKSIKTNIFTTNYDNLLYKAFLNDNEIFGGSFQNSKLIDGFYKKNTNKHPIFSPENIWNNELNHGLYIHLHGNPHFYEDEDGNVCKSKRHEPSLDQSINHIVLCATSQKIRHISSSSFLQSYFEMFQYRLKASKAIVLFGCAGSDKHINKIIKRLKRRDSKIYVVEWEGAHDKRIKDRNTCMSNAEQFWSTELGINDSSQIKHFPLESIFTFDFQAEILL